MYENQKGLALIYGGIKRAIFDFSKGFALVSKYCKLVFKIVL